jgi:hypothetical protein
MKTLHKKLTVLLLAIFITVAYISCQKQLEGDGITITTLTSASVEGYVI